MTFVQHTYKFNKREMRELHYQRTRTANLIKHHKRRQAELEEKLARINAQLNDLTLA